MTSNPFPARRSRSAAALRLEALEDRCCPTCSSRLWDGTLFLLGDAGPNRMAIVDDGARGVRVTCDGSEPRLFTGRIDRVVLSTAGDNDSVQYAFGDPGGMPRDLLAVLGADDDVLTIDATAGMFGDPGGRPVFAALAGDGIDAVTVRLAGVIQTQPLLAVDLGADNDTYVLDATATWLPPPGSDRPVGLTSVVYGGAGNDSILAHVGFNPQPDPPGNAVFQLTAFGGGGNDRLVATGLGEVSGNDMLIDLSGGTGDDDLSASYRGAINGDYRLVLAGGDGNDRASADLVFAEGSRGRVEAVVRGGGGNDALSLLIDDPGELPVAALIDGGDGFDTCRRTRNVRAINCESDEVVGP